MTRWLVFALLVGGCGREPSRAAADSPGARLELAAETAGLVAAPAASIQGSWARDTDRVCVIDIGGRKSRIGVTIDYGAGQQCAAAGTVERSGERLAIDLQGCTFDARLDGDHIVFPAELPEACNTLCTGRATLDALAVDRLSGSRSEASTLRSAKGELLCRD